MKKSTISDLIGAELTGLSNPHSSILYMDFSKGGADNVTARITLEFCEWFIYKKNAMIFDAGSENVLTAATYLLRSEISDIQWIMHIDRNNMRDELLIKILFTNGIVIRVYRHDDAPDIYQSLSINLMSISFKDKSCRQVHFREDGQILFMEGERDRPNDIL